MKERVKRSPGLDALIVGLITGIFLLDCMTPLDVSVWTLYVIPLVLSVQGPREGLPFTIGLVTSGLVMLAYPISASVGGATALAPLNRGVLIMMLLLVGVVGRRFVTTKLLLLKEDWIKQGLNELNQAMRGSPAVETLGEKTLATLARYIEAPLGVAYVQQPDGSFARVAGYAGPRAVEGQDERVGSGESLVGQAALGTELLLIEDLPQDYIEIRSGLGAATPNTLALLPLHVEEAVHGVLELGFFKPPSPAAISLLEEVAEPIGVALRSARYNERQRELLEQTQRQAQELLEHERELRAANEELEEHGQALRETQRELEEQRSELEATNANLERQTRVLEEQKERLLTTQELLRHKAAEVERASQYKSEFLANMSHELRTPLNSSLILAKLLADNEDGNLTEDQVQYAANIYAAGNDLLHLINDILDLAKIESGTTDLSIQTVDLHGLLQGLQRRFEASASQKGLTLSLVTDPDLPNAVATDPLRLQQILSNLLSNAIKFTEEGTITVRVTRLHSNAVEISVEDTGIGIPADKHEVIFEAFRQADGTTNRRFGGTGLGLSISRELALLLGGDLRVESAPREGSRFTLTLPTTATAPLPTAVEAPQPPAPTGTPTRALGPQPVDDRDDLTDPARVVLVVEDDSTFAAILRDLAHELRFQCVIARGADEGLQLAREYQPAAIILDVGLPDHSGLTVLEILKRSPETRHIPIHVISVHDYERVARRLGAVGYALKPVKREALQEAFRSLDERLARKARRILVLDDDDVQREAIRDLLHGEGVEITSVATVGEAVECLRSTTFDCMILDLMLPGASGFDLLSRLGEDELAHPPVIVYTARALTPDEEQSLRQHAKSIIIKGARSPERLLEEVTLFLHQVESDLPEEKRRMLQVARNREAIFEGRRLLLVEDDVRNIYALTSSLEPKGAIIDIARNGREALDRVMADPPIDLILMDIMMPEMDGLSATREIRKDPRFAKLPIIALTAKAMPDDRKACLEAGASDYIAKPIEMEKLISMLRVWMPQR